MRIIHEPKLNAVVAKAPADNHSGSAKRIKATCILWENALTRRIKPADPRKAKLAAVRVTGYDQRSAHLRVGRR